MGLEEERYFYCVKSTVYLWGKCQESNVCLDLNVV